MQQVSCWSLDGIPVTGPNLYFYQKDIVSCLFHHDWWFGTSILLFHAVGNVIIPTDFPIQRGWNSTTNHGTSHISDLIFVGDYQIPASHQWGGEFSFRLPLSTSWFAGDVGGMGRNRGAFSLNGGLVSVLNKPKKVWHGMTVWVLSVEWGDNGIVLGPMENGPVESSLIYPLKMEIFHSYVNIYQRVSVVSV